jgi:hypothetical protein
MSNVAPTTANAELFRVVARLLHAVCVARTPALSLLAPEDDPTSEGSDFARNSQNYFPRRCKECKAGNPDDVCNTFVVTYQQLKEFEADLHKHVHLGNNILFLKATQLLKGEYLEQHFYK